MCLTPSTRSMGSASIVLGLGRMVDARGAMVQRGTPAILLVDDSRANLLVLEAVLAPLGYRLVQAQSGKEALRRILLEDFAVILMDVMMSELDGFQTAALIKQRERSRYTPIIFITALGIERQHIDRGYAEGAVDYITKPFDYDVLRAKVRVFVELFQRGEEIKRQSALLLEHEREALRWKSIEESEARFRHLAETVPQMVWTARPDGWRDYFNQRWFDYTGLTLTASAGWGWSKVVHPDDRERAVEEWKRALHDGAPFEMQIRYRRSSDGSYRWHLTRARARRDGEDQIVKWFGTATDVDDQRRLDEERVELIAALQRSNAELDQFAYVASHDLRAPLRGVANLSQWIEEDLGSALPDETREKIHLLRRQVDRLMGLVSGILDYSRAGRIPRNPVTVDVGALLKEVIELLAPPRDAVIEVADDMPTLRSTVVPLEQVFMNLIGNALKHARRADPHVKITVREAGELYEFSIIDNGPGIPEEHHQRIWEVFQTLESRDTVEGTGIGLSVVRKVIESHGGRVWVESKQGQGATFRFLWPRDEAPR